VQSYNGRLDYGLIACRRAVPDVNDLADALLNEHRMLLELARAQAPVPPEALGTVTPAKAAPAVVRLPKAAARPRAVPVKAAPVKTPARKRASRVAARA